MEMDGYGYEDDMANKGWMKKAGMPSEKTSLTPEKAKTMLKEGEAHGKPLSSDQKGFFGAVAGKGEKKEK